MDKKADNLVLSCGLSVAVWFFSYPFPCWLEIFLRLQHFIGCHNSTGSGIGVTFASRSSVKGSVKAAPQRRGWGGKGFRIVLFSDHMYSDATAVAVGGGSVVPSGQREASS